MVDRTGLNTISHLKTSQNSTVSRVYEVCIDNSGSGSGSAGSSIKGLNVRLSLRLAVANPAPSRQRAPPPFGGRRRARKQPQLSYVACSYCIIYIHTSCFYQQPDLQIWAPSLFEISGTRTDLLGRNAVAQTLSDHRNRAPVLNAYNYRCLPRNWKAHTRQPHNLVG